MLRTGTLFENLYERRVKTIMASIRKWFGQSNALPGLFLVGILFQQDTPTSLEEFIQRYGLLLLRIVLFLLMVRGIWILTGIALEAISDYQRFKKTKGVVTKEEFTKFFEGDTWMIIGGALLILIPGALFFNWNIIQNLVNRFFSTLGEI